MTDKAAIHAEFEEAKPVKTRKVLQIVCEVPMERADEALEALGGFPIPGQSRPVAIALLKAEITDNETAEWPQAKRNMVQRSGIMRNDKGFQDYVLNGWPRVWNHPRHQEAEPSERAAYFIRTYCGVSSCRDLDPHGESGQRFRNLMVSYEASEQGRSDSALLDQRDRRQTG